MANTPTMRWAVIAVRVAAESAEAVSEMLLRAGSAGVGEVGSAIRTLTGCLPVTDGLEAALNGLRDRLDTLPDCGLPAVEEITLSYAEEADWANEWKKHFHPQEIGRRLVIRPSWEPYTGDPNRVQVLLDPGMAFGTGGHPTTCLCLKALEDLVKPGMVVADIGTGSGILSLAAARMGATTVLATDIDDLPRNIARENVAKNGLADVVKILDMDEFDTAAHNCDLVVANIIAVTIVEITPSVRTRLNPGGLFVASGIVEERLPQVLTALDQAGFELVDTHSDDIWRLTIARLR